MLYIGVDLGTSAVKLLLMDEKGAIKKIVSKEYPLFFPHPGWSEQKPEDWFEQTMAGLKELVAECDKSQVAGISFGGQMHGLVILDKEDQVISAHRQSLCGRELVVYQLGLGVLQQLHAVVGLHLGAESAGGLCVHLPCKQLQIHLLHACPPHFVQNRIFSPSCTRFRMSASSRLVSPLGSLRVTERLPPRFSAARPPPEAMERAI